MSYNCEICGEHFDGKPTRVIMDTRMKEYPVRKNGKTIVDYGGVGCEIAEEANACEECGNGVNTVTFSEEARVLNHRLKSYRLEE